MPRRRLAQGGCARRGSGGAGVKLEHADRLDQPHRLLLQPAAQRRQHEWGMRRADQAILYDNLAELRSTAALEREQAEVLDKAVDVARSFLPVLEAAAAKISELDALSGMAWVAASAPGGYVRPKISDDGWRPPHSSGVGAGAGAGAGAGSGGGASLNGFNSGAGSNGAQGCILVFEYYV